MSGMEIPLVMMAAGTATSAAGQVMAGREQNRAAQYDAASATFDQQQQEREAELQKTAGASAEAARNREFVSSMNTVEAIRAGRGAGLASPGGLTLLDSATTAEDRDVRAEKLGYLLKSDNARMGAKISGDRATNFREKGKYSLLAGYLGAASTVATGASKGYMMYNYPQGAARS